MSVSSKWYVSNIEGQMVHLHPVCRGVENREWATATPGGQMSMVIQNDAALAQFQKGEEYEAVFVHKPKPAPHDGHEVQVVEQKAWDDKTVWLCGACGSYAYLNEDGTPNWSRHEELYRR